MTELGKLYVMQQRTTFWVKSQDEADMDMCVTYNPGDICMLLSVEVDNGPWHKPGEPDELRLTCLGNDGTVFCSWQDGTYRASMPWLRPHAVPLEEVT
jgi:hypothetical protein